MQNDLYVPVNKEGLLHLPAVRAAFSGTEIGDDSVVKIADLSSRMRTAPLGLTREAQHLILTALVAQQQFEFVTFSGNRINHRSLDLQIIWEDIEGIAEPFADVYSSERLREWAMLISGNTQIKSLDRSEDRLLLIDTLTGWQRNWKEARFLETFESLPDECLNSSIWTIAANLRKTFGVLAEIIDSLLQNMIPLDECLHRIADLFSDSEAEYESKKKDLNMLRHFTQGAAKREEISTYLALCETTNDSEIEKIRRALLDQTGNSYFAADPAVIEEINMLWRNFKELYVDHYVEKHDAMMNSKVSIDNLNAVLRSDKWSAFESLSDLPWFDPHFSQGAKSLIRNTRHLNCSQDVRLQLEFRPFCSCSFKLARFERRKDPSSRLEIFINQGLLFFRSRVEQNADLLIKAIDTLASADSAASLKLRLAQSSDVTYFSNLTTEEVQVLRSAILKTDKSLPETRIPKRSTLEDFRELFPNELREWEDEIDNLELFANTK